jgi:hypothetical protein
MCIDEFFAAVSYDSEPQVNVSIDEYFGFITADCGVQVDGGIAGHYEVDVADSGVQTDPAPAMGSELLSLEGHWHTSQQLVACKAMEISVDDSASADVHVEAWLDPLLAVGDSCAVLDRGGIESLDSVVPPRALHSEGPAASAGFGDGGDCIVGGNTSCGSGD